MERRQCVVYCHEIQIFHSVTLGRALSDSPERTGVSSVSSLMRVSVRGSLFSLYFYQGRKKLLAVTFYLKSVFKKENNKLIKIVFFSGEVRDWNMAIILNQVSF